MTYLGSPKEQRWLKQLEFDRLIYDVPLDRFINRLQTERNLFDGPLISIFKTSPCICLALLVTDISDGALERTLRSWSLQSCPNTDCVLIAAGEAVPDAALRKWISERPEFSFARVFESRSGRSIENLSNAHYVTFSFPGDLIHPSTATISAIHTARNQPTVIVWNEIFLAPDFEQTPHSISRKLARLSRKPSFQRHTLNHVNYIGLAFAVESEILNTYPGDLVDELLLNRGHLFHLWLSDHQEVTWQTHPEYLITRVLPRQPKSPFEETESFIPRYREFFNQSHPQFEFLEQTLKQQPYKLTPLRRAKRISVIIPYRDAVPMTCKCVEALSKQNVTGELEIVLVNNQSDSRSISQLKAFTKHFQNRITFLFADYNKPFNHSAQCNLGIRKSTGEAVVLMNNDAIVNSPTAIEEVAAWSLVPGVATVSVQITTNAGDLICAGVVARQVFGDQSTAFANESRDREYSKMVRQTFANTFAFSAISRETFEKLGPLDAVEFPNGYNDVEYSLRASEAGYIHMYLGNLRVFHTPGTTRSPTDERLQKSSLRNMYPSVLRTALFQFEEDRELRKRIAANDPWRHSQRRFGRFSFRRLFTFSK